MLSLMNEVDARGVIFIASGALVPRTLNIAIYLIGRPRVYLNVKMDF